MRRDSRAYSERVAATYEEGDSPFFDISNLTKTADKKRNNAIWGFLTWGFLNLALWSYIMIITFTFWNDWFLERCISRLSIFIIGCAYIQGFHTLRKIVLIVVWSKADDPSYLQAKIDFWFILFVVIPEIAFYIYGNCIVYDQ